MKLTSPLRYPGGKAALAVFLADVIDKNDIQGCDYYEPYAGGAGAALKLLQGDRVSTIHLNDADPRISAFWQSVICDTEKFIDCIQEVELSVDEWRRQRAIYKEPQKAQTFDLGFSTFYLNRCNRSGVLNAGPIGGQKQDGQWRLDVRFNRDTLSKRIRAIGEVRGAISIHQEDALAFLKQQVPRGNKRKGVFVYLDPPYVQKAQSLYLNAYSPKDHASVATYMCSQRKMPWLMSYDNCELIQSLYSTCQLSTIPVRYSLNRKLISDELVIAPPHLNFPFDTAIKVNKSPEMV